MTEIATGLEILAMNVTKTVVGLWPKRKQRNKVLTKYV